MKEAYEGTRTMGYGETRRFLRGLTDGTYQMFRGPRWEQVEDFNFQWLGQRGRGGLTFCAVWVKGRD